MTVKICLAAKQSVQAVENLIRKFHLEHGDPLDEDTLLRALQAISSSDPLLWCWLLSKEERYLGYIAITVGYSIEVGGRDGFVDELYVVPEERSKGYARLLLAHAYQESRNLGLRRLCLEAEPLNKGAISIYEKEGFINGGRMLMFKEL